jgi:hypothetical protein
MKRAPAGPAATKVEAAAAHCMNRRLESDIFTILNLALHHNDANMPARSSQF